MYSVSLLELIQLKEQEFVSIAVTELISSPVEERMDAGFVTSAFNFVSTNHPL
jgi:hypothetical protein